MQLRDLEPGASFGPGPWLTVEQARVDRFAEASSDGQWIHTDPARAAEGPFGTTVAHGFLTLSLLSPLFDELVAFDDSALSINYGLDRVRFPAPVPVGSRIRATFEVASLHEIEGGIQAAFDARVEREGSEKPACVATMIFRFLRGEGTRARGLSPSGMHPHR
jgi:acyl dehydratase